MDEEIRDDQAADETPDDKQSTGWTTPGASEEESLIWRMPDASDDADSAVEIEEPFFTGGHVEESHPVPHEPLGAEETVAADAAIDDLIADLPEERVAEQAQSDASAGDEFLPVEPVAAVENAPEDEFAATEAEPVEVAPAEPASAVEPEPQPADAESVTADDAAEIEPANDAIGAEPLASDDATEAGPFEASEGAAIEGPEEPMPDDSQVSQDDVPTLLLPPLDMGPAMPVENAETPVIIPLAEPMAEPFAEMPGTAVTEVAPASVPASTPAPSVVGVDAVPAGVDIPETRSNLWVWIGLVVGVVIMASALGYGWWYVTSRPISVPNVVGRLPGQAVQTLNDADLRLGKMTEVPTDTAPAGTVIEQTPSAFKKLKPGATVSLVLAGPPETTKVPGVVGVSSDEANTTLASSRLVSHTVRSYSPTVALGFVISQVPTAGVDAPPGSAVALLVSDGPEPTSVRVPHLIGMKEVDAAALLATMDVRPGTVRSFDSSSPAGTIVAQNPAPEGQVAFDGSVQFLVSKGTGTNSVTVPNVVSQVRSSGEQRLKDVGLKAKVVLDTSSTVPKGNVIAQLPAAGAKTSSGETVIVVVSRGSVPTAAVPDVAGKTADEAAKAISSAGFGSVAVKSRTSAFTAGQVIGQLPAAGTTWTFRYPVIVLIAEAP